MEKVLIEELRELEFQDLVPIIGGVEFSGDWYQVWRANVYLRTATRILVRLGEFPAVHLAQLDKRAHRFPWQDHLKAQHPVRVEVVSRKSKIYHARAAAERIENAIIHTVGNRISKDSDICIKVRIEKNLVKISIDSTGDGLHKRGYKSYTGKAPIRETLAAAFLRMCNFDPSEPLIDPMCGSGTFVIEAAEISVGMAPGRKRAFTFQKLKSFDSELFKMLTSNYKMVPKLESTFFGYDRDNGAIKNSMQNAHAANVSHITNFNSQSISDLVPLSNDRGLIILNPPYGARIGDKKKLYPLYAKLGMVLRTNFSGWRVGLITSDGSLARTTEIKFSFVSEPINHGGLRVKLYQATL